MYIYNHFHIWRAARNVKIPPANNYVQQLYAHIATAPMFLTCSVDASVAMLIQLRAFG